MVDRSYCLGLDQLGAMLLDDGGRAPSDPESLFRARQTSVARIKQKRTTSVGFSRTGRSFVTENEFTFTR
jgi:hypothetical protein